jgi:Fe-S oxidoreductase
VVAVPPQEPCGVVPLVYGRIEAARNIARRNTARLRPFVAAGYTVVASEPTAALMIRKDYPLLLGERSPVFESTFELGSFLYRRWKDGSFPLELNVEAARWAYHRPCHLFELEECGPGFRELFAEALGLPLAPLPESCCGMSGTFGMRSKYSEVSREIGAGIFSALREGDYPAFLTECSSCRLQIEGESGVRGMHPAEILT